MKFFADTRCRKGIAAFITLVMMLSMVTLVFAASEIEPNDSPSTATPLSLGTDMTGRINSSSDNDYYKITLPTNGSIEITYNFTAGDPKHYVQLYNSSNTSVGKWTMDNIPYPYTTNRLRLPAGDYYVLVGRTSQYNSNYTDDYTIRVDFKDESGGNYEVEPNNAFSTANTLTLNKPIIGGLNNSADDDYFKFTIDSRQEVTVKYDFSGNPRHVIRLYDSDQKQVFKETMDDRVYPYTNNQVLNAGTYYVHITNGSQYNANYKDDYTLTVQTSGGTVTPDPDPDPTPTPDPDPDPTPTPDPDPDEEDGYPVGGFDGESLTVGAKLWWYPIGGGVGYRVYRSEQSGVEGISVTDFYITSNEFVDVNVDANTTYYYTVRQVISEAKPFEGLKEVLGPASSQIRITTPSTIIGGNGSDNSNQKKFILMTLNDRYMSVNGVRQEIDPGRDTVPLLLNARTMVPIRAVVESMGGTVGWTESSQQIDLAYDSYTVRMWVDNRNITVNGSSKTIDVAPTVIKYRTMTPLRFAAENLGAEVEWINSTQQIVIVYK